MPKKNGDDWKPSANLVAIADGITSLTYTDMAWLCGRVHLALPHRGKPNPQGIAEALVKAAGHVHSNAGAGKITDIGIRSGPMIDGAGETVAG